jgi:hypothetical protein
MLITAVTSICVAADTNPPRKVLKSSPWARRFSLVRPGDMGHTTRRPQSRLDPASTSAISISQMGPCAHLPSQFRDARHTKSEDLALSEC